MKPISVINNHIKDLGFSLGAIYDYGFKVKFSSDFTQEQLSSLSPIYPAPEGYGFNYEENFPDWIDYSEEQKADFKRNKEEYNYYLDKHKESLVKRNQEIINILKNLEVIPNVVYVANSNRVYIDDTSFMCYIALDEFCNFAYRFATLIFKDKPIVHVLFDTWMPKALNQRQQLELKFDFM